MNTRLPFDPAELAMLHETGYFGVSPERLEEIAAEIRRGEPLFDAAWSCGTDPDNLSEEDIACLRHMLDEEQE